MVLNSEIYLELIIQVTEKGQGRSPSAQMPPTLGPEAVGTGHTKLGRAWGQCQSHASSRPWPCLLSETLPGSPIPWCPGKAGAWLSPHPGAQEAARASPNIAIFCSSVQGELWEAAAGPTGNIHILSGAQAPLSAEMGAS